MPPRADLSVKITMPASIPVSDSIEPVVTVRNRGPRDAKHVVLTVRLPFELEATGGRGFRCGDAATPGLVRCTAARLSARRTLSIRFLGTTTEPGTLIVQASVRSATRDPSGRNNSDAAAATVSLF